MVNPLTELIPAAYRKQVYLVASAALAVYALWEVSRGDVKAFLIALASGLVSALAGANTPAADVTPAVPADEDYELEEDLGGDFEEGV